MNIEKISAIHNQIREYKDEIEEVSNEFETLESAIITYNSSIDNIKEIKLGLDNTKDKLNIIKSIIDQELENIEKMQNKLESINELQQVQELGEHVSKIKLITNRINIALNELNSIRDFIITRAKRIKMIIAIFSGTSATGGIGLLQYPQVIEYIKTLF